MKNVAEQSRPMNARHRLDDPGLAARMAAAGRLFDFDDHFDFDHGVERQRCDADGGARVASFISEYGNKQIGAAIEHLRVGLEIPGRVDEAADANDAFHPGEIAKFAVQGGQQPEGGLAGCGLCFLNGGVAAEFPGDYLAVRAERNVAGEKRERAAADEGDVVRDRRSRIRERQAQARELLLGARRRLLSRQRCEREKNAKNGGDKYAQVHDWQRAGAREAGELTL